MVRNRRGAEYIEEGMRKTCGSLGRGAGLGGSCGLDFPGKGSSARLSS